jgi:hypothetical protein
MGPSPIETPRILARPSSALSVNDHHALTKNSIPPVPNLKGSLHLHTFRLQNPPVVGPAIAPGPCLALSLDDGSTETAPFFGLVQRLSAYQETYHHPL